MPSHSTTDAARDEAADSLARARAGLSYATYHAAVDGLVDGGGFATREAVELAAALLDAAEPSEHSEQLLGVRVGPACVQLVTSGVGLLAGSTPPGKKQAVTHWSGKSRANMVRTMAQLDWSPIVDPPRAGWRPAMVTYTAPRDWEAVHPDGRTYKAQLEQMDKRWERAFGPTPQVWKLEFQRRGAPHRHTYQAVPPGLWTLVVTRTGGSRWSSDIVVEPFAQWLSRNWTEVVFGIDLGARTGEDWPEFLARVHDEHGPRVMDHLQAGTGVDYGEGIRASDPKRLAVYFASKATQHNIGEDKEYQHQVPDAWQGEGGRVLGGKLHGPGPGRFWGYRRLDKATEDVLLDLDQFVQLRRALRRWTRRQGRPVRALERGRIAGGFALINDGPAWVSQIARWEALTREDDHG